jgi:hypothetical protein
LLKVPNTNLQLLSKPFPKFDHFITWRITNDGTILGSESNGTTAVYAIFKNTDLLAYKEISLANINLEFSKHNSSGICCNKYLIVLASNGLCVFDCLSETPEVPLFIINSDVKHYIIDCVTLTKNHFLCYLGNEKSRQYQYFIFDMISLKHKKIPDYYENFFSHIRVEQVNDNLVHIHSYDHGKFTIDLNSLSLTSETKKAKPYDNNNHFLSLDSFSLCDLEGRHVRGGWNSVLVREV